MDFKLNQEKVKQTICKKIIPAYLFNLLVIDGFVYFFLEEFAA